MTNAAAQLNPTAAIERLHAALVRFAAAEHGEDWDSAAAELAAAGENFNRVVTDAARPAFVAANDNEPLPVINPADWSGTPVPQRQWFIDGLVPMRQVTILNGDGGVGKSLLALQFAVASALSVDTLGLQPLAGRVMYLGAEDEAEEFHRRLADIVSALDADLEGLADFRLIPMADLNALLATPSRAGVMEPTAVWNRFAAYAREFGPRLIVLDTAADLFGGDEIKRAQVRQFLSMVRGLAMEIDCAIILLAHPSVAGIQSGSGSSGSTAWSNSARSRIYMTKPAGDDVDPDARILTSMKSNYGRTGDAIRMRWEDGVFVLDGEANPSAGRKLLDGRSDRLFLDLLSKLNRQGQACSPNRSSTYAPTVMSRHPDGKSTGKVALEGAMHRLLDDGRIKVVTDGPPSKPRSRLWVTSEAFCE